MKNNMNKAQYWLIDLGDDEWTLLDNIHFHLVDRKTLDEIYNTNYYDIDTPIIHTISGEEVSELLPTSDSKASFYETIWKFD